MDKLPAIPTPISARLRELRVRFLPPVMFLGTVAICALVWHDGLRLSSLPAVGEGVRSTMAAPQAGTVLQIKVRPYQMVQKGDPLVVLMPMDPSRELDLLRSELQLAQLRLQPSLAEQNAFDYERVKVELLRTKSELAIAKVNFERADNTLRRTVPLFEGKIVSEDVYDLALKTRDMYRAEVDVKSNNVVQIEHQLGVLNSLGDPILILSNNPAPLMLKRLEQAHLAVTTNWGPVTLVAPISGMVTVLPHQEGEFVPDGEPLLIINGLWSDRIVGYLRQPYAVEPHVGMEVRITTRDVKRQSFVAEIAQVGVQTEIITNALAYLRQGTLVDVGLPVVVNIPKEVKIRPGEVVDMLMTKKKRQSARPEAQALITGQAEPGRSSL